MVFTITVFPKSMANVAKLFGYSAIFSKAFFSEPVGMGVLGINHGIVFPQDIVSSKERQRSG